jgi:hypothetical protein
MTDNYEPIDTKPDGLDVYKKGEIDSKFKYVNIILGTAFLVLLFMVATLIIDSFHFNSATYREYSEKTNSIDELMKSNEELLNENKYNQELIIEQQSQILNLLNEIEDK